jgi:tetratricopeptide (TPR) repeat protein
MKPHHTFLAAILIATALAQPPAATWIDQSESDIGLAADNEPDPAKKLDLLKKWEQQYPNTAFKANRTFLTTQALTNLITAAFGKPDGPPLEAGRKAARQLLEGMNTYFDDSLRALPQLAQKSPADWAKIRTTYEMQAHALLAYCAALKKDDAAAEAEYRKVLTIDPSQAASSYQLGAAILREIKTSGDLAQFSEALYSLARSLSVSGPNALPPAGQSAARKFLDANYSNYHGGKDGMDDLMNQAANAALPPAGFHILSVDEITAAKAKDHAIWAAQHPELDFWETIRTALTAKDGDTFFTDHLQGVALPPPPVAMFKATVVSVPSPKQILVNLDNAAGDAILKFDETIKGEIPPGTTIEFKGVADAYTKDPAYILTLEIQDPKTDITGLPEGVRFIRAAATKAATKPAHP